MYIGMSCRLPRARGEKQRGRKDKVANEKRERERHFIALTALYFAPIEKSENVHGFVHNADLVFRR